MSEKQENTIEYSKSKLDLLFYPRSWHKRMSPAMLSLIPGFIAVGLFNVLGSGAPIFNDFILSAQSGIALKLLIFVVFSVLVGAMDVFCFAWPIADLCRYLAKRSEKFIIPGFNVVLMKSYAYSHLLFIPVLLLMYPTGLQVRELNASTPFFTQLIVRILQVMLYSKLFWQIGIMLRTISVKSKLTISAKLVVGAGMLLWYNLEGIAEESLIHLGYQMFEAFEKII